MTNQGTIPVVDDSPANLKLLTDAKAQPELTATRLVGAMAICGGGLVLVGWAFDITALKSVLPGWVTMMPNTAITFILSGIALLFAGPSLPKLLSRLSQLCAWLVGSIGLLSLVEYAFGWNLGFDQWLFREPAGPAGALYPGRMAPDTALCFILLAAGMEIARRARRRTGMFVASAILGLLVTTVAFFEILSCFTPHLRLSGWSGWTMMALPTAALFAALSAAIVWGAWRNTLGLRLTQFASHFWWMSGCVGVLAIAFALSARSEAQVNRANELRYRSFLLADELRQSSDDLTRMAQTYVMTGNPVYKQRYQDILNIRNDRQPRPERYWQISGDLMPPGGPAPIPQSRPAISLLELMRQAGFADEEFRKLGEATANSDELTRLEVAAMKRVESTGPNAEADRAKGRLMLFDDHYHQAKAAIMKPMDEVFVMVDQRTLAAVHTAENLASIFRYIFAAFGLGLMFMLWRTYLALSDILGGGVDEVRAHITKIGSGDFSSIIKVKDSRKNSVLGWLSAMQAKLITTARDRQQAEEARHRSAAEFRALAEAMPQMVWITRPDGWNMYFSQQWMDYTGLTLEESLGHGWNKPFHPEDQQRAWDAWQHAVATTGIYSVECRLRRADGVYRWWLIRGVPQLDATGHILKWFGTCTDIHDLKSAEQEISQTNRELRESDEKFHQLADNISDVFWMTSPDFTVMHYINQRYERIWGRSTGSLYANPHQWIEAILPEERDQAFAAFAPIMGNEPEMTVEYRIARPDGSIRWIHDRGFQVRDAAGKLIRLAGIASDITERKRSDAELEQAHQELVKASRQAGRAEFATGVLHNVGNVLNSVNLASTCVRDSLKKSKAANLSKVVALLREHETDLGAFLTSDPQGKQLPGYLAQLSAHLVSEQEAALKELAQLQKNIEHIRSLITVQQDSARQPSAPEVINLMELVEDALKMNANGLARAGVHVTKEFEKVPPILTQKHQVLHILANLVRNAKQACQTPNGQENRLTIRVSQQAGRVRIAVADNGSGISPENLAKIFTHGFTTKKDGHGFGLHSATLAAKEMGGSLTVHSDGPGQGATFTLELPGPAREDAHE